MKIKYLPIFILIYFISCDDDDRNYVYGFPPGIEVVDTVSVSDCALSECSTGRIIRYTAINVGGKLYKSDLVGDNVYFIHYPASFDSYLDLIVCEIPSEFDLDLSDGEGVEVIYSGDILDPCGIREAIWPAEEVYFLRITKIEKR